MSKNKNQNTPKTKAILEHVEVVQDSQVLIFTEDKYVDGDLVYKKLTEYEIPKASVERWIKRGGILASEFEMPEQEEVVEKEDGAEGGGELTPPATPEGDGDQAHDDHGVSISVDDQITE